MQDGDGRGGGRGGRRIMARRRGCEFCADKIHTPDYKQADRLRRYVGERGRLEPRRKTGACATHQRRVAVAVKRARQVALLPYTAEHIRLSGVPAGRSMGRR